MNGSLKGAEADPLVSYTRGNDLSGRMEGAGGIGGLLARSDGYSSGNWTSHNFYFADGNGNITYMLNSSQAMVASYRYDPFGNTISSSGTLANANVYRFSSKEIHANSGMYYYGLRFYDPNLQRWISRDPIAERGGINLYGFVLNRPVALVDGLGAGSLPNINWQDLLPILFPPPDPPPAPVPALPPEPVLPPAPIPGLGPLAFCLAMSPITCGDLVLAPDGSWWCNGRPLPGPFGTPPKPKEICVKARDYPDETGRRVYECPSGFKVVHFDSQCDAQTTFHDLP